MNREVSFTDDLIHPGEHLKDTLESLGLSQTELAKRIGMSRKVINEIILGKAPVLAGTAILLERVIKTPAHIWTNLQKNYDLNIAYIIEKEKLKKESELLNNFPVSKMMKYCWIPKTRSNEEKVKYLLSFFSVSSLANIENSLSVQFRRSFNNTASRESIFAWLRQGELEINKMDIKSFNEEGLKEELFNLRCLTNTSPDVFQEEIKTICASVGVAVAFVPELPKTYINGATYWFESFTKSAMLLSLRFKTNDHLWFSFFHELGHIILHRKKENFLDITNVELSKDDKTKEIEADRFAANLLIPKSDWKQFKYSTPFSTNRVLGFSKQIGIAPGIVVGRLQREGLLPYTHLNGLKVKYRWILN